MSTIEIIGTIIVSFMSGFALASIIWHSVVRTAQQNTDAAIKQAEKAIEVSRDWERLYEMRRTR